MCWSWKMNQSIKMYINLNSFSESHPETGGKIHTFKLGKTMKINCLIQFTFRSFGITSNLLFHANSLHESSTPVKSHALNSFFFFFGPMYLPHWTDSTHSPFACLNPSCPMDPCQISCPNHVAFLHKFFLLSNSTAFKAMLVLTCVLLVYFNIIKWMYNYRFYT